jgi:hypothetical protein
MHTFIVCICKHDTSQLRTCMHLCTCTYGARARPRGANHLNASRGLHKLAPSRCEYAYGHASDADSSQTPHAFPHPMHTYMQIISCTYICMHDCDIHCDVNFQHCNALPKRNNICLARMPLTSNWNATRGTRKLAPPHGATTTLRCKLQSSSWTPQACTLRCTHADL